MHCFRDSTQRKMVVSYRRFGTTCRHIFQGPSSPRRKISRVSNLPSWTAGPLKMAPIGCPKTSVRNYHSTLRKFPKERRPGHLIRHVHKEGSGTAGESVGKGCTSIAGVWLKGFYLQGLRHLFPIACRITAGGNCQISAFRAKNSRL